MKHQTPPAINHDHMTETLMADRYLMGKLNSEDAQWFENHFPTCEDCLEALELAEALQKVVRIYADQEEAQHQPAIAKPRKLETYKWSGLGMAAGLLLGLIFPHLSITQPSPAPMLNVPFHYLVAERSSNQGMTDITFRSQDQDAILIFPTGAETDSYRLVFRNSTNHLIHQTEWQKTSEDRMLVLLHRNDFDPGTYLLDIEKKRPDQPASLFAQHRIRILYLDSE